MAQKRITLETEPHVYEIDLGPDRGGVVELLFRPEAMSTEFADAQQDLNEAREQLKEIEDRRQQTVAAEAGLRRFLAGFMLADSAKAFVTFDKTGKVMKHKLALPDWVLNDITQWVIELYGRRPTGSSSDSSPSPPTGGKASTAAGPSKGSTRTRGRSRG